MASNDNSIQGIWVPALTPLDQTFTPDHGMAVTHVRQLLRQGCHGVVLFGSTGEANSFSVGERRALLEALVAADVPPRQLMVGTGCCALSDTIALSQHALSLGCHKLLVLPPFYYKNPGEQGLFESYARLIEKLDDQARIVLYHIPKMSAVALEGTLVRALIAYYGPLIAGFKDSAGDPQQTLQRISDFPELSVLTGNETALLECLHAGGAGCITATANINAEEIRRTWDLYLKDDPEMRGAQAAIDEVRTVFNQLPMISALKWVIAKRNNDDRWLTLCPPLEPLSVLDAERLMRQLNIGGE